MSENLGAGETVRGGTAFSVSGVSGKEIYGKAHLNEGRNQNNQNDRELGSGQGGEHKSLHSGHWPPQRARGNI